jgi:hypothetical protein
MFQLLDAPPADRVDQMTHALLRSADARNHAKGARFARWRTGAACLLALASAGCQNLDAGWPDTVNKPSRSSREVAMNLQWQNHRLSELVSAMGEPRMILRIPGGGNPPGFAVIYGTDPVTGCIDAFAMYYGFDPTVRQYLCR